MDGWNRSPLARIADWLDQLDPGAHRRVKGLRVVTAFGIAAMLGTMGDIRRGLPFAVPLSMLAGNFALWSSILEGRGTRGKSSRDLLLLSAAAAIGALSFIVIGPLLMPLGGAWPELVLALGAFCVGYLRRFGLTGTGMGAQIFIGEILACTAKLQSADILAVVAAALIAGVASLVPRMLSGPAEHPPPRLPLVATSGRLSPELAMGLQGVAGVLVVVTLNITIGLLEFVWAIAASTFVIAGTANGTIERVKRRIVGTAIGVPVGLALLPMAAELPMFAWAAAALAMIIYVMAIPERYEVSCGAYAVALILTLALAGQHSLALLAARGWETLLGGLIGLGAATLLFPLRVPTEASLSQAEKPQG